MRGRIFLAGLLVGVIVVVVVALRWRGAEQAQVVVDPKLPVDQQVAPQPPIADKPAFKTFTPAEAIAALEQAGVALVRDQDVVTAADFPPNSSADLLVYLTAFEQLRGLTMRGMTVGAKHLAPLTQLKQLQILELEDGTLSDDSFGDLAEHESLAIVMLQRINADDDDVTAISRLPKLDSLLLTDTQVTLVGVGQFRLARPEVMLRVRPLPTDERVVVKRLVQLKGKVAFNARGKVTWIDLTGTDVTDDDLRDLRWLSEIKSLTLCKTKITDDGLKHLETLTSLEELFVNGSQVTNQELRRLRQQLPRLGTIDDNSLAANLSERSGLRGLTLPSRDDIHAPEFHSGLSRRFVGQELDANDVEAMSRHENLVALYLIDSTLTEESWPALTKLTQLKSIYIRGGKVNLSGIATSPDKDWFDRIELMYLVDVDVSAAELAHLVWFRGLIKLTLVGEQVTDEVVTDLIRLPALRQLSLVRTSVTDKSIPALSQLSTLRALYVTQTKFTKEGLDELGIALPDCTIHR